MHRKIVRHVCHLPRIISCCCF